MVIAALQQADFLGGVLELCHSEWPAAPVGELLRFADIYIEATIDQVGVANLVAHVEHSSG